MCNFGPVCSFCARVCCVLCMCNIFSKEEAAYCVRIQKGTPCIDVHSVADKRAGGATESGLENATMGLTAVERCR